VLRAAHGYAQCPAEASRAEWERRRQRYALAIVAWELGANLVGTVYLPRDGAEHVEWTLATEAALRLSSAALDHLAGVGGRKPVLDAIEAVRHAAERFAAVAQWSAEEVADAA
jgi:hypothetical protein